ncbi:MAG TPA: efflux transporter outer membrane subunit [Terriglobia bacterium]|jgi:multidrug efflux system outer membrane protein|nr:efflux transporter outer membrane subunit [Terriglobia bacterium]
MKKLLLLGPLIFLTACMVGPKYQRPPVSVPQVYRAQMTAATAASLGNEKWWEVYQDPILVQLIHTALTRNYDLRIAATRVIESQSALGITRANQFPFVNVGAGIFSQRNAKITKIFPAYKINAGRVDLSVIWDLDFWGKYRRETQAARAELLATEWGQRAVVSSLVSSVATAYFQLRALDDELEIARRTLSARQESLRLILVLEKNGSASQLDVSQAQELVDAAAEAIPELERQIQQQENLIRNLLGEDPGPVPRGRPLTEQPAPARVPAGLPSELLERRPDIRMAEANLVAANARIGVVKAALFPDISLTGTGGFESFALNKLISTSGEMWNGAVNLTQPVFEAGALRAGVRLARAQWQEMVLTYQQTIQQAFVQVSNALIACQKDREYRRQQQKLAQAAEEADRLSTVLYRNGGASYLQVLTSETNYFAAELNLVQAQLNERLALVELYQALGGGWQQ